MMISFASFARQSRSAESVVVLVLALALVDEVMAALRFLEGLGSGLASAEPSWYLRAEGMATQLAVKGSWMSEVSLVV